MIRSFLHPAPYLCGKFRNRYGGQMSQTLIGSGFQPFFLVQLLHFAGPGKQWRKKDGIGASKDHCRARNGQP